MKNRYAVAFAAALLLTSLAYAGTLRRSGQVSVTTAAAIEIGDADPGRYSICLSNDDVTNPVYCGDSTASSTTGKKLSPGNWLCIDSKAQSGEPSAQTSIWCRATGSTVTVSYIEYSNQ